jgi:predicted transcriptional regulator
MIFFGVFFNRVFMFQEMESGDSIMITAQVSVYKTVYIVYSVYSTNCVYMCYRSRVP